MTQKHQRGKTDKADLDLPSVITSVKPQKRRKGRFSLFHESTFLVGVTAETVSALNLQNGTVLTRKLLEEIERKENQAGLRSWTLMMLGRRDHCRSELENKAAKKGYAPNDVSALLDEFEQKGYIDDEAFAEKFLTDKINLDNWGPKKVEQKLFQKGVRPSAISKALNQKPDNLQLKQICVDLVVSRGKRFMREKDEYKRKQKIFSFLLQRGFQYETINRALPDIFVNLDV